VSQGEVIELEPPLPGLARMVRIEFRNGDMGRLSRSEPCSRVEATHAEIHTEGPTGKKTKEDVELAVVDDYLKAVDAFRRRIFEKQQENDVAKEVRQEHLALRAQVQAAFSSPCTRCGVDRERGEDQHVVVGRPPDQDARTSTTTGFISMPTITYVEYVCPVCGSVEWFRRSHLEHPPPGG
jgi:hypothetical protein